MKVIIIENLDFQADLIRAIKFKRPKTSEIFGFQRFSFNIAENRQQTKKAWDCVQRYLRSGSFPDCKNIYVDGTYYSE